MRIEGTRFIRSSASHPFTSSILSSGSIGWMEDSPVEHKRRKHKKTGAERPTEVLEAGVAKLPPLNAITPIEPELAVEEEILSIWVQLEGCDPVPVIVNPRMTVHDLKLLLGGFQPSPTTSYSLKIHRLVQRQQIELLGLVGIRPQQLKLKVESTSLSPPSPLNSVVSDGTIVQITIVQSPVTPALTISGSSQASSAPTDPETQRFMSSMRQEIDFLRRRLLSPTPPISQDLHASSSAIGSPDEALFDNPGGGTFMNRMELLEAKLDLKNSTPRVLSMDFFFSKSFSNVFCSAQLETMMKELKTVTLALRGLAPTAAPGGPPDKGPSTLTTHYPLLYWKHFPSILLSTH